MVKLFYLTALTLGLSLSATTAWGTERENSFVMEAPVMKALPIYSNDLIDEAPEGEVVTGIRDCYSAIYKGSISERGFENGVIGEYVIGTDDNIYLRNVCYSANIDTYLKLEKVDDATYVAHTPQLIWVDSLSDGSLFTAYATRVVFSQKSATSFGYDVQQNTDGTYDTDIYFTFKDGKLMQSNMNTTEMNEEIFPEELIGFTTSTGGWIGFGDGCLQIYEPDSKPTSLPEGADVSEYSLNYTLLHVRDIELNNAVLVKYAELGDDIYLSNPSAGTEQWIKGTIDREKGTATFLKQYLGMDTEKGFAVWFIPVTYDKYKDILDEETGFGDWFRTYAATDKLVLSYDNGMLTGLPGYAMYFSHSSEELLMTGVYAEPYIRSYEPKSVTPAPVVFTKFEPMDELWGFGVVGFAIPSMDTDKVYISTDELYYNLFADDSTTPFVFSPEDYIDMEVSSMTDVPYGYFEDFDFKVSGVNHTLYFYHDWNKVGIQVIQKHDGVETRSEIVYIDKNGVNAVEALDAEMNDTPTTYKYIDKGEIIIVRNGVKYNAQGMPLR